MWYTYSVIANGVNNAHKVKRGVVRILASLGIGMVIFGALGGAAYVFAIPPLSPYDPNETLDPTCAPGDINCTVVTPIAGIGTLGQIGFFSGTSTIASDSKFTFSSSTGDLGLVSDSAQFKLGALSDVGITRSVVGTLKITDGSTGLGSIHIGGMTFGTASGLLKATAGVVSTATTSDADLILPIQTGNSGRFLTTNGATSSWAIVPSSQWTTSGSDIYYNSGNVGIGTIAPSSKLHVLGGARIEGDANNTTLAGYLSSSTINIYNGNTTNSNYASIGFSSYFERVGVINMNGYPAAGMGAQFLSHVSASSFNFPTDLYFWTGYSPIGDGLGTPSSEKMRITAAGNVGIGTSTPQGLLEVASSTSKTTLFTVLPNGNVGIGTTSPAYLFDLNSSSATYARFKSATAGDGAITFGGSTGKASLTAVPSSGTGYAALQFYTNNTPTLHMDTSGYIGIATTTTSGALFTLGAATTTTLTDLLINPSAKLAGNLIDAQVGGVSKFKVDNVGAIASGQISTNNSILVTGGSVQSDTIRNYLTNNTLTLNATNYSTAGRFAVTLGGGTHSQTTGTNGALTITPIYNQATGNAANTDLLINRTETAVGSGAQYLIDARVGGVSKFSVSNTGAVSSAATIAGATSIGSGSYVLHNSNGLQYVSALAARIYGGAVTSGNAFPWIIQSGDGATKTGGYVAINTDGAEAMRVISGGNVGIGTATPLGLLTLGAATTTTLTDLLINPAAKAAGNLIDAQVGGVSRFSVSNAGNGYFAGNVGIGTTTPTSILTLGDNSQATSSLLINTTWNTPSKTFSALQLNVTNSSSSASSKLIEAKIDGTSAFYVYNTSGSNVRVVSNNGYAGNSFYSAAGATTNGFNFYQWGGANLSGTGNSTAFAAVSGAVQNQRTAGLQVGLSIAPTYNQSSGTASNTDLLINRTETAVGSGAQYLIDAQVGGVSKFSVSNTGNVLIGTSTASGVFVVATSTATSPLLTVLNSGNVGIGTTTPSNLLNIDVGSLSNAGITLSTNGSARAQLSRGGSGGAGRLTLSADGQTNLVDLYPTLGYSFSNTVPFSIGTDKLVVSSGNVGIGTSTPQGLLEVASSTSKTTLFTVLPNGNVGIGTTTPAAKLEIVDAGSSTSIISSGVNNFQSFVMRKSDVANGIKDWIFQKREDTFFGGSAGSFIIYGDNYSGGGHSSYIAPVIFNTNGNILMAAASNATNGYVGIGTVSPAALLEVNSNIVTAYGAGLESRNSGSGYIAGTSGFYPLASSVGSNDTVIKYAAGTNSFVIQHGTDKVMAIDQNGNVGIGTTTPSERLHIYDASDSTIVVGRAGSPTTLSEWSYNGGVVSFGARSSDAVQFIYNNSQKILLNGAGVSVSSGTNFNVDAGTLYVDGTYDRVGIATTSTTTSAVLTIGAATTTTLTDLLINPSAKNAGNLIDAQVGGVSKFSVTNTGSLTAVAVSASSGFFGTATTLNANYLRNGVSNSRTGDGYLLAITGAAARTNTSGDQQFFAILPSYNQSSGTASNTDLFINRTETAVGSGAQYLIDAQVGSVSKFSVTNTGRGYFAGGISIATSSTAYGIIVGDGSTQKDVYIPKGGLCVDDDNAGCASTPTAGTIYAKATAITGIDVAEHYPTNDVSLESGDVVSFSTQNSTFIEKSTASSTQYLAGVISTEPGVLLGKNIENARPVALNGRVPVKVSNENGAINIGDYLTISSQPGVAAKATSPGMTIGMALEAYNQSGVGKITVFVHTGFALGSSEAASGGEGGLITLFTRTFASIGITIENGITSIKQLIVDKITTKELCVEDLCLNKEQLKFILDRNGITIGSPIPTQESLPPAQTPPVTASSTEEAIPTETPIETPIETPVPTQAPPESTTSDTPPSPEPSTSPSEQTQSPTETAAPETPSQ